MRNPRLKLEEDFKGAVSLVGTCAKILASKDPFAEVARMFERAAEEEKKEEKKKGEREESWKGSKREKVEDTREVIDAEWEEVKDHG